MAVIQGHLKNVNGLQINDADMAYTNTFKSKVWTWLARFPQLTFPEYQNKAHDKITRKDAFDEVKRDMQEHCIWDAMQGRMIPATPRNKERLESLQTSTPLNIIAPSPVAPIIPPAPSVANQIAMMTSTDGKRQRKPLDATLKTMARDELIKQPRVTYDELQTIIQWPEFTKSSYYSMRQDLIKEGLITEQILGGVGRRPSEEMVRLRELFMAMPIDELRNHTAVTFRKTKGNANVEGPTFVRAQAYVLSKRTTGTRAKALRSPIANPMQAVAPAAKPMVIAEDPDVVSPTPVLKANTVVIMATIDMAGIPADYHKAVAEKFDMYFEERCRQASKENNLRTVLLTYPPCLEIRKVPI